MKAVLQHKSGRPYIVVIENDAIVHGWGPHLSVDYALNCIKRGGPWVWDDARLLPLFARKPADYSIVWKQQEAQA